MIGMATAAITTALPTVDTPSAEKYVYVARPCIPSDLSAYLLLLVFWVRQPFVLMLLQLFNYCVLC